MAQRMLPLVSPVITAVGGASPYPAAPGVGCDTHHDILYIFYRTKRRFKGLCQRNEYLSDFNFCDFHIIVLFLLSEHFSTLQRL